MIRYASDAIFYRAHKVAWEQMLIELLLWVYSRIDDTDTIITSAWRPRPIHPNDSGIASTDPLRHFDLRSRGMRKPNELAMTVNAFWRYDPKRPDKNCCLYHDSGLGWHLHFQIHKNTEGPL